jgi:hypothetical protein
MKNISKVGRARQIISEQSVSTVTSSKPLSNFKSGPSSHRGELSARKDEGVKETSKTRGKAGSV